MQSFAAPIWLDRKRWLVQISPVLRGGNKNLSNLKYTIIDLTHTLQLCINCLTNINRWTIVAHVRVVKNVKLPLRERGLLKNSGRNSTATENVAVIQMQKPRAFLKFNVLLPRLSLY